MDRITEQVERLPPALRSVLDAELAAGNTVASVEFGRGLDAGKVQLVLKQPLRATPESVSPGLTFKQADVKGMHLTFVMLPDESMGLVHVKTKPIVFQKITGPENPTKAHVKSMLEREQEQAEAPAASSPRERFLESMAIDYERWHDGIGYDLAALKELGPRELEEVERVLIAHTPRDWRDIDALHALDTPRARAAIEAALSDPDHHVRMKALACNTAKGHASREALLVESLETAGFYGGLTQALDEVVEFHPQPVLDALLRGALHREGEVAVHFAALLLYLYGKAKAPFDDEQRPFCLRFATDDQELRELAFLTLCETIGVDALKY